MALDAISPPNPTLASAYLHPHAAASAFMPLLSETRVGVETDCAAFHLNRTPQTLRVWACKGSGPIRPRRVNGRLMWSVADLRKLCGLADRSAA